LKALFVGLGSIGQRHVRNLRTLVGDAAEIHAVRSRGLGHVIGDDLTIEPGADLEARYGIVREPDLEGALAGGPTAVFVTNPTSLHVPVALAAADARAHIFVEKPLSDDLEGVPRLIEAVERLSLVSLVGYQLRFHPCVRKVSELLRSGAVGALLTVRLEVAEYLPGTHTYEDYRQMYTSRRDLGGGVIVSQIHELDLAYWLFGMPKRVFALGGRWSSLEIDVEDTASMLLECIHDGRPLPVYVHQDFVQRPANRRCEIVGEEGKILLDLNVPEVRLVDPSGRADVYAPAGFDRNELFLQELRHFLACLEGTETPVVSIREGARSLEIALAARESIETGGAVELT
jgi:predicted dehydrogenase